MNSKSSLTTKINELGSMGVIKRVAPWMTFLATITMISSSQAAVYTLTITGDGILNTGSEETETPIGITFAEFTYDTEDFSLSNTFSFGAGVTGSEWSAALPIPISVSAGGAIYPVLPIVSIRMFDQPDSFDQWNFRTAEGIPLQWNDRTSGAFTGPITNDLEIANSLFANELANNASFQLSNGSGTFFRNGDGYVEINNAVVTIELTTVPEPSSLGFFGVPVGMLLLGRRRRDRNV